MSLNKVSEDLYKFLLDNLQDKRLVNDKLYKTGLTFLFSELKSNIQYEKLLKLRYMLIINELKNIKHFFAEENIPFVVLKGVSLAQRLYSKPYNRMFGDIDILVSSKNLFIAIKILEMLGYKSENETDKESVDFFLQQVSRELHFYPFYKSLINSVEITIEVHVDIVSLWMFRTNCQLTDYILSRRKIENGIPMMDEYDTIIFQSMHLIKHYINDLTGGFINGIIENTLNLKGFHEIALLVDKYIDTLDSKKFSDRVIEFGANKEVQVIIMWLMKAYPSLAKVQDLSIYT